jgi:protein MpaA
VNPPYASLVAAWRALRATHDASVREVACVGASRTLLVAEIVGEPRSAVVTLSAGVHGDEPAGPWSLLSIVRDGLLDRRFTYRIWPCTNPTGYALGTRENAEGDDINRSFQRGGTTPEARAIVTANRDRQFALSLDLHEDFEAEGYYCYEPVMRGVTPFGAAAIAALDDAAFPVQEFDDAFDIGYEPEAHHLRALQRGRILNDPAAERAFYDVTPYSIYLLKRAARFALTLETPRSRPWDDRIAMHRTAVTTILGVLACELRRPGGDAAS